MSSPPTQLLPETLVPRLPPDCWGPWQRDIVTDDNSPSGLKPSCCTPVCRSVKFSCNLCRDSFSRREQWLEHLGDVHTSDLCTVKCDQCKNDVTDNLASSLHQADSEYAEFMNQAHLPDEALEKNIDVEVKVEGAKQDDSGQCKRTLKLRPLTEILTEQALEGLAKVPPRDAAVAAGVNSVNDPSENAQQPKALNQTHRETKEGMNSSTVFLRGNSDDLAKLTKKIVSEYFGYDLKKFRWFPAFETIIIDLESPVEAERFDGRTVTINNKEFKTSREICQNKKKFFLLRLYEIPCSVNAKDIRRFFTSRGVLDLLDIFMRRDCFAAVVAFGTRSDYQRWEGKQLHIKSATIHTSEMRPVSGITSGQLRIAGLKKNVTREDITESFQNAGRPITSVTFPAGNTGSAIVTFKSREDANTWEDGEMNEIKNCVITFIKPTKK